ncbi:protocatechuate 3,4-dioxygenase [Stenotrophomonas tumulicola]|uniref:Intradiol ring-cleavage dioxygenases domain-containing protein n=1 Tax=Stenotrophomonas tumulicola TaxID=1685415 RepID=A0A7W3IGL2_9GAMM|nr:protocatechuate 3,4-dioxygenase [Stenotrophomonas tumulicola]MBA8680361.1 hypothetical protein [Stenotrophomonas tumulicola]
MPTTISRRHALRAMGLAASTLVTPSLFARQQQRLTAAEIMGPFYPLQRPLDDDSDLTRVSGQPGRALGQAFDLRGRIIDTQGRPVGGAMVEMWQANRHGRYAHKSDPNLTAPIDPAFQGFGKQASDHEGRFRFLTIIPGPYPVIEDNKRWTRTPHIHFDIRGRHDRLVTQIYFKGQALNDTDLLYQALSAQDRDTVTLDLQPADPGAPAPLFGEWTVVLASG